MRQRRGPSAVLLPLGAAAAHLTCSCAHSLIGRTSMHLLLRCILSPGLPTPTILPGTNPTHLPAPSTVVPGPHSPFVCSLCLFVQAFLICGITDPSCSGPCRRRAPLDCVPSRPRQGSPGLRMALKGAPPFRFVSISPHFSRPQRTAARRTRVILTSVQPFCCVARHP